MKKPLVTMLIAIPLLALSSTAAAAEPIASGYSSVEPMLLSADQMDGITAGSSHSHGHFSGLPSIGERGGGAGGPQSNGLQSFILKLANVTQINMSPVTIIQIGDYNTAIVYSGNFSTILQ